MKKSFVLVGSALLLAALLVSCNGNTHTSSASSSPAAISSPAVLSSSASSALTKKAITLYEGSPSTSAQLDAYFEAANPDVPLLSTDEIGGFLAQLKGFASQKTTFSLTGKLLTLTLEDGRTALFDFEKKTITFPNAEKFFAGRFQSRVWTRLALSPPMPMGNRFISSWPKILTSSTAIRWWPISAPTRSR